VPRSGILLSFLAAGERRAPRGAQKKLFFNMRKLRGQMQAIEEGDFARAR